MARKGEIRTKQTEAAMNLVPGSITDEKQKRQFAGSIARHQRHERGRISTQKVQDAKSNRRGPDWHLEGADPAVLKDPWY